MRILIAPDKFKGSLTAREVADNIAVGLREVLPDAKIDIMPMADGGEGTAEVISDALGGKWLTMSAHDARGREIEARYAYIDDRKLAVMEMSEAAGMRRLQPNEYDVDLANTFGVGEMILEATRHGAREIIIGLGGSATNDGGFGMARKLGFRFFEQEQELRDGVIELLRLTRIERPNVVEALGLSAQAKDRRSPRRAPLQHLPKTIAAADVRNVLLGEDGATRMFGPQKGATSDQIEILERALTRLADVVARDLHVDFRDEPGAGAAGGLGFGLMSFCGAIVRPGFDVVAEAVGLEAKMKDADLVITGEGSLDRQTLEGKTPAGVARLARKLGKRVYAIVGRASEDRPARELFDGVYELTQPGMSEQESIANAGKLLRARGRELVAALRETLNAQRSTSNAE
jgi:glycerate kinase